MEKVPCEKWFALFGAMLGAFMAVLDIQITNASLNDISGALGCSLDEGSWISTAYLVAEIVVIGCTAWLAQVFSIKRYLLFSTVGFVACSIFCAFAQNLNMMIVGRALQGLTGGALIPLAMTVNLLILPPKMQPVGSAIFAMTATFAPAIGPTIGGWLTDNYGWQWIFFINIVPGILMFFLIATYLEPGRPKPELLREGDYWGILTMAIGLGSLEYVLEEGERKDWFGNPLIVRLFIVAVVFIILFLIIEFTTKKPFVNLRVFGNRRFSLCCVILGALGLALYGTVYLIPLYLAQVQGYSPFQIGITLMWVGLPQLFILPFVPQLMKIVDPRVIAGIGLLLFAGSCFMDGFLDLNFGMDQFRVSNIVRAIGQPLIFVPLLSMCTEDIPRHEAGSASALFNMTRNIGGSIGIATLSTILTQREHLHSVRIGESVTVYTPAVQARLDTLSTLFQDKGLDPTTSSRYALQALNLTVQQQSYLMAYSDCFLVIGAALLLSGASLLFLPKSHAMLVELPEPTNPITIMKYEIHNDPRLNFQQAAPDGIKALSSLSAYVAKNVEAKLRSLIELRVSQINGCAFCCNMHSQEARAAGESQQRLDVLPAWHETTFFTEPERAALTWAEQVTRLGEEPVPDELYAEMRRHFSEKEILDQTLVIAVMNSWNRISIAFRNRPPARKE